MEEYKPVALWKGILGTVLSSVILLVLIPLILVFSFLYKENPIWVQVILYTSAIVCLVSLIISVINLTSTIDYKKEQTAKRKDNVELLDKLLSEGKITAEEYLRLK